MVFIVVHRETTAYADESRSAILGVFRTLKKVEAFLRGHVQEAYEDAIPKAEEKVIDLFDQSPPPPKQTNSPQYIHFDDEELKVKIWDDCDLEIEISVEKWKVE